LWQVNPKNSCKVASNSGGLRDHSRRVQRPETSYASDARSQILNRELREQHHTYSSWLQAYNRCAVLLNKTKAATTIITFFTAHNRVIIFALVAFCAFWFSRGALHHSYFVPYFVVFATIIASQLFWIRRVLDVGQRVIPGKPRRTWLAVIAAVVWVFFFFAYSFNPCHIPADPKLRRMLIDGAFSVWVVGSWLGFGLVIIFWVVEQGARRVIWAYRYARGGVASLATAPAADAVALPSPDRRHLLRQMAIAVSATPFVAAAYGLLYSRLDVEVTHWRIALARLPKAFEGFRIAQLSDIHISSFMPADEIRRCVTMTNQLEADLVVLTGDYVSWDPAAQEEVVQALAGLRAPYGVFGCLGNHEVITQTEESITRLFAAVGIRILRQERASIRRGEEALNLIGVDDSLVDLQAIQSLVTPKTVNILLVHNIGHDFEGAVQFGFDLILMGHTHGGQLSLEFLRRGLSFARIETPYVSGWYEKSGGQLYVNRGIGTTIIPIRVGARPEITVLELVRGV
jgi:predicted MPP superfamily phosphohydrolase